MAPTSSYRLTVKVASRLLSSGSITSEELCRYCYNVAMAGEQIWKLNAFSRIVALDDLLENARAADERRKLGNPLSIFDGVPISVKANLAVATEPLTAGSKILGEGDNEVNACGYDADAVRILVRDCGGILVGITNMDEFGMGSLGTNVIGGSHSMGEPTRNPLPYLQSLWKKERLFSDIKNGDQSRTYDDMFTEMILQSSENIDRAHLEALDDSNGGEETYYYSAGGSSCGSAASVAHGSSLVSIGTDTGGSIRLPASWCGVVGLKPSYGLISRHGVVSYASSFDTVGILAPSVRCAAIILEKLAQKESQQQKANGSTSNINTNNHHTNDKNSNNSKEPVMDSNSSFYLNSEYESLNSLVQMQGDGYNNDDDGKAEQKKYTLSGIKIGIPAALSIAESSAALKQTWSHGANQLQDCGATVQILSNEIISPGVLQKCLAAYYVLVSAEASSNLARYDGFRFGGCAASHTAKISSMQGDNDIDVLEQSFTPLQQKYAATRMDGFGSEVVRRILCGTSVLSSDRFHTHYESAAILRAILVQQFEDALENNVDFLFLPTTLFPLPCPLGIVDSGSRGNGSTSNSVSRVVVDNTEMFANDIMTVPISLAGLPAISVPLNITSSSSASSSSSRNKNQLFTTAGFQLVGSRLQEGNLLRVANALECMNNSN